MDWGVFPEHDEDQADWKIADAAIAKMQTVPKDKPWFIACGFRLPHVPCFASQKWFDLYPDGHAADAAGEGGRPRRPAEVRRLPALEAARAAAEDAAVILDEWKPLVRAYLASVSFMDSQVGRVLDALAKSGALDNTIVIVWGDHGWHLGEKGITGKNTLWERSTRVPFIWAGPGVSKGAKCARPVSCSISSRRCWNSAACPRVLISKGTASLAQLKDATAPREWPAITTHNQGNHTIRTEKWRYIRYADGSEELYDETGGSQRMDEPRG